MKSKTSLFDPGLFRHLLRRFWPLFLGYFVLLMLLLPVSLPSSTYTYKLKLDIFTLNLVYKVLELCTSSVILSFGAGVCFAGAMFHFLFQSRSCGMIHSLPLRRETIFTTAWLAGLLPMLLADLLVMLITWLLNLEGGVRVFEALVAWLWATVLANLFFYHFAILCAQLTGSLVILPLVYVVLNYTADVVTNCVYSLGGRLLYGVNMTYAAWLNYASPSGEMFCDLQARAVMTNGELRGYVLDGLGTLGVYALVSLLFLALALWLYRRRHLESASDVVAVPVLKPVFKYCMCFGTALVFASGMLDILNIDKLYHWKEVLVFLLLLLIGAFLGYFVAEMLLRKSLRVLRGAWRGFLVSAAVLGLLLAVVKADVFGIQCRVPSPDEVSMASLSVTTLGINFTEPEDIAALTAFHRHLVERGPESRSDEDYQLYDRVPIRYILADGRVLERFYDIFTDEDALVKEHLALINRPGVILNRVKITETKTDWIEGEEKEFHVQISGGSILAPHNSGVYASKELLELTAGEVRELYEEGVLPDAGEGHIDLRRYAYDYLEYDNDVILQIILSPQEQGYEDYESTIQIRICAESENTLRWLEAHGLTLDIKD